MRKVGFLKTFVIVVCAFNLVLIMPSSKINSQSALNIISTSSLALDTSITREDVNFNLPKKIIIAPIYPTSTEIELTPTEHYRGLYYYTVEKLGFNDIPFHYVVSDEGDIFEGNAGGDERKIKVEKVGDDVVLIGYMTENFSNTFSKKSIGPLTRLITSISNRNSIDPSNISMSGINFIRNQSTRSVSIEATNVFGSWNVDLETIKQNVANEYNPVNKIYSVKIDNVTAPTEEVNPGDIHTISLTLSNLNPAGMYAQTDSEIIVTRVGDNFSAFFLNNVWSSQTQVPIMKEGEILLPLEQATFTFEVIAPLYIGERTEEFELRTLSGQVIDNSRFSLTLNMKRPTKPIVEITETETGTLNVRGEPSSVGPIISQVSPGQRFFQLADEGNGFIQIDLGGGRSGWVLNRYVRYL